MSLSEPRWKPSGGYHCTQGGRGDRLIAGIAMSSLTQQEWWQGWINWLSAITTSLSYLTESLSSA